MPRKRTRRHVISIDNPDLLNSTVFTRACGESLPVLAIICEYAFECGFVDLVELYGDSPDIVERMCDRARTALRGLRKLERRKT